jgi:hypothetical protein
MIQSFIEAFPPLNMWEMFAGQVASPETGSVVYLPHEDGDWLRSPKHRVLKERQSDG